MNRNHLIINQIEKPLILYKIYIGYITTQFVYMSEKKIDLLLLRYHSGRSLLNLHFDKYSRALVPISRHYNNKFD